MAAPAGTTWGSIVGGYGRIGINVSVSDTATTRTATIQVWFWSKYSVSDNTNNFYFDVTSSSGGSATTSIGTRSISTTVASGEGWSTSNQVKIYETTKSYTRGSANENKYIYARLSAVDVVGLQMTVSTYFTVLKKASYNISYDANGGSGAPSAQTAIYGSSLKLSTTKPTREGYTFLGWATNSQAETATHSPGYSYTFTAATTLYAVWVRISYTVTYNANGGSGAPTEQTKDHGVALTLSPLKPTRSGYTFLGWAKSSAAQSAEYASGQSYTENAAITLYAVWDKTYQKPSIYNLTATRCNENGTPDDAGKCAKISFQWKTQSAVVSITYDFVSSTVWNSTSGSINGIGTSGTVDKIVLNSEKFDETSSFDITVTVSDSGGSSSVKATLTFTTFGIDFHPGETGCDGVSFGKPASLGAGDSLGGVGVADFGFDAKFNEPVYGKALGMDRLPAIPENADFNDYIEPGCYAVYGNAVAETISNIPVNRAGRLEVWSATGEGVRLEQWSYLRQRYIPYNRSNAVWEREVTRGEDNVWNYYEWWRSSLNPAASEKVYSKAAITASMSADVTLGKVNTYTQVPLPNAAVATSERLYIDGNSVKIGADISYVKVSGQLSLMCKSVTGKRHARVQKVSGSTTTSYAWDCITAEIADETDTILNFSPVIIPVKAGDILKIVYYTPDANDLCYSGNVTNGWKTYLTVEEI